MPTYEYACTECGRPLEAVQKFTDDPLTECPVCGGKLRKLFRSVGVVFKGSGFYRTDSRAGATVAACSSSEGGSTSTADAGSSSTTSESSSSKPDAASSDSSKPAATPTAKTAAPASSDSKSSKPKSSGSKPAADS